MYCNPHWLDVFIGTPKAMCAKSISPKDSFSFKESMMSSILVRLPNIFLNAFFVHTYISLSRCSTNLLSKRTGIKGNQSIPDSC